MQTADVWQWMTLAGICLASAGLALAWLASGRRTPQFPEFLRGDKWRDPVFLFDGSSLMQATVSARSLVRDKHEGTDWARLVTALRPRFSGFPESPEQIQDCGIIVLGSDRDEDSGEVLAEWLDGIVRVHVRQNNAPADQCGMNVHKIKQMEQELETLRQVMDGAPYPAWQIDKEGTVTWHNTAYRNLYEKIHSCLPDSAKRLFQTSLDDRESGSKVRASIPVKGQDRSYWFDVSISRFDDVRVFYAIDVNAVVNAEIAQRNFVQTLAKTFAQLSIGLAIFDRNRQLALFNPALIDLTALPADFLSARPNLLSFFDRLRDNQMMPEPKNYSTWRDQMAELVAAAADGSYSEIWSLPSGSTYRVSGRPHPDGAIAFLIEDITAEVTLTRRFRSELELSQSMLDRLDDAIVVFSGNGVVTLSNRAYREMWGVDPDSSFADMTIMDSTKDWQRRCKPTPVLGEIKDFVLGVENRAEWMAQITLKEGEQVACSVHPVQSGATMVSFRHLASVFDPGLDSPELQSALT
jgi:PAS domain-containing protein